MVSATFKTLKNYIYTQILNVLCCKHLKHLFFHFFIVFLNLSFCYNITGERFTDAAGLVEGFLGFY